jgi:cysteinyl-tRNA synthetase
LASIEEARNNFILSMDDDFNTPQALSSIFNFLRTVNKELPKFTVSEAGLVTSFLWEIDEVLGLNLDKTRPFSKPLPSYLNERILEREDARKRGDWQTADAIRDELLREGIELQDTSDGVKYKKL